MSLLISLPPPTFRLLIKSKTISSPLWLTRRIFSCVFSLYVAAFFSRNVTQVFLLQGMSVSSWAWERKKKNPQVCLSSSWWCLIHIQLRLSRPLICVYSIRLVWTYFVRELSVFLSLFLSVWSFLLIHHGLVLKHQYSTLFSLTHFFPFPRVFIFILWGMIAA